MENLYVHQAEIDYRRDRIARDWQPVRRRRRERAEAVRRIIANLR